MLKDKKSVYSPWSKIKVAIADFFAATFNVSFEDAFSTLIVPTEADKGDLTSTISFKLAKIKKSKPFEIAKSAEKKLENLPYTQNIDIAPNGFINIHLNSKQLAKETLQWISEKKEKYGKIDGLENKNIIVEFPSVNPSKPWHVGHARNAVLGDTLTRFFRVFGFNVIAMDYINDLGLQIAQLVWKIPQAKQWDSRQKYDHYLGELYVEVAKYFEDNPKEMDEVYEILQLMEQGDNETASLSREMTKKCLEAQRKTAHRMGIFHNAQVWENHIARSKLFESGIKKMMEFPGIIKATSGEKAGCIVANLEQFPEFAKEQDTKKVLVRSNGTGTYTGTDTVFQLWKFGLIHDPFSYEKIPTNLDGKDLWSTSESGESRPWGKIDTVYNVIMVHQSQPQRLIYTILDLMNFKTQAQNSHHLAYNQVKLPGKKLSGRKGTWIGHTTDDLLDEAVKRAKAEVIQRNPKLSKKDIDETSEAVGIGSVRYAFLKQSSEKEITFLWDQVLDFDGMAAPYIQYSALRAKRILEKVHPSSDTPDFTLLTHQKEHALIKLLAQLPDILVNIATEEKKDTWGTKISLHNIAYYAYNVAVSFARFYDNCRVAQAETLQLRDARRTLVEATFNVLKHTLDIMGIPLPKRM
ncbi:MAG: arginine--tRNA ligase [Candidatus Ranarchaeia archaeon]|jgi:arginyl-tRNA synthetase